MRYLQLIESGQSPIAQSEQLDDENRARELLAIGLRQTAGVARERFKQVTGFDAEALFGSKLAQLRNAGLVVADASSIRLTRKGLMLCDWIASEIL